MSKDKTPEEVEREEELARLAKSNPDALPEKPAKPPKDDDKE